MIKKLQIAILLILSAVAANAQHQLWSMTTWGGSSNNAGTIFKMNLDGSDYSTPCIFPWPLGWNPNGSLLKASNGKLYGMTQSGGTNSI
jgi:hypothetical protein